MRRVLIVLGALAIVLAACGGNEDGPGGASAELTVELTEFAFDPAEVSVPAGEEITVTVNNVGSVEHNWIVLARGTRIAEESEIPDDLAGFALVASETLDPGSSATVTFTATSGDAYQIICSLPGHFTAGMEGRLRVEG